MSSIRRMKQVSCTCAVLVAALLSGCSYVQAEPAWKQAVAGDGPGNPNLLVSEPEVVTNLPKSRSGNRPEYEVFGIRYAVLDSARDYREQGVASWYGSKFHGNATASGEIYDMHRLTAAHKHLPLPTFVRVTRQDNGASIVVKVNDRGPFVGDRIIDLSYAAASALDMLGSGKAMVTIEAISDHEVGEVEAQASSVAFQEVQEVQVTDHYVQVGAFAEQANAHSLMDRVLASTKLPSRLDFEPQRQLYQVLVGPFSDHLVVQEALQLLNSEGFEGYPAPRSAGS